MPINPTLDSTGGERGERMFRPSFPMADTRVICWFPGDVRGKPDAVCVGEPVPRAGWDGGGGVGRSDQQAAVSVAARRRRTRTAARPQPCRRRAGNSRIA